MYFAEVSLYYLDPVTTTFFQILYN